MRKTAFVDRWGPYMMDSYNSHRACDLMCVLTGSVGVELRRERQARARRSFRCAGAIALLLQSILLQACIHQQVIAADHPCQNCEQRTKPWVLSDSWGATREPIQVDKVPAEGGKVCWGGMSEVVIETNWYHAIAWIFTLGMHTYVDLRWKCEERSQQHEGQNE